MIKYFSPDVLLHPDPLHTPLQKQQNVDKHSQLAKIPVLI